MANMENDPKAKDILDQEIALDDLNAVAGGASSDDGCVEGFTRNIYGGKGFPNCAATVEDGSWCGSNDACATIMVYYTGMKGCGGSDCHKAWR